jgi:hypothetical protein
LVFGQSEHPKPWKPGNKFIKNCQKNIIFPKGFLHNRVKKIFFNVKVFNPEAVHIHAWAYPNMTRNGVKISLDCPFKNPSHIFFVFGATFCSVFPNSP